MHASYRLEAHNRCLRGRSPKPRAGDSPRPTLEPYRGPFASHTVKSNVEPVQTSRQASSSCSTQVPLRDQSPRPTLESCTSRPTIDSLSLSSHTGSVSDSLSGLKPLIAVLRAEGEADDCIRKDGRSAAHRDVNPLLPVSACEEEEEEASTAAPSCIESSDKSTDELWSLRQWSLRQVRHTPSNDDFDSDFSSKSQAYEDALYAAALSAYAAPDRTPALRLDSQNLRSWQMHCASESSLGHLGDALQVALERTGPGDCLSSRDGKTIAAVGRGYSAGLAVTAGAAAGIRSACSTHNVAEESSWGANLISGFSDFFSEPAS